MERKIELNYKHSCVIDTNFIYKTLVLVLLTQADQGQEQEWKVQNYTLAEGEQLVDTAPPTVRTYAGDVGFVRPKWDADASSWSEAATEAEIAAWETEHPDPNAKTVEELRADKEAGLSAACNEAIVAGLDIQLPGGTTEHFDYSERDQINIKEMFDAVLMGATMYPYQSEDGSCRTYTAAEIVTIYPALAGNKTAQLTYYHQLKDYIDTLDTAEEIQAVTYGQPLTGEYLEHYNEMVAVAAEQMQTVVARLTSAMSA